MSADNRSVIVRNGEGFSVLTEFLSSDYPLRAVGPRDRVYPTLEDAVEAATLDGAEYGYRLDKSVYRTSMEKQVAAATASESDVYETDMAFAMREAFGN